MGEGINESHFPECWLVGLSCLIGCCTDWAESTHSTQSSERMFPVWPLFDRPGRTVTFRYGYKSNIMHNWLVLRIMWEKCICSVSLPWEFPVGGRRWCAVFDPPRSPHSITGSLDHFTALNAVRKHQDLAAESWLSITHTSAISLLMLIG